MPEFLEIFLEIKDMYIKLNPSTTFLLCSTENEDAVSTAICTINVKRYKSNDMQVQRQNDTFCVG